VRVLYVITGLATGGAEKQLVRLLAGLQGYGVEAGVVSLRPRGPVSAEIEALGVPVWHLGVGGLLRLPAAAWQLAKISRRFRPDVIQGWMYHGNLAALLAAQVAGMPVVWGIRQSLYDLQREKPGTRLAIRLGARWSRQAAAIVYNAATSRAQHEAFGFSADRGRLIDNGFDTQRFRPDREARLSVRKELGLAHETPLIGKIARYHPMKGHEVFLAAAARLAERKKNVHFVLAGRDVTPQNPALADGLCHPALAGRVHCLGERADIPRLTAALDIASSSSSWGEAFPNAVGEAMSSGVPVVATDVGDVRRIVGEAGVVVPVGDAAALALAWVELLANNSARQHMGQAARKWVLDFFSAEVMVRRYLGLYGELVHDR
jgi:glycosyltransferase involved in cell wall biosynthesis